jgi:hypothetical protein
MAQSGMDRRKATSNGGSVPTGPSEEYLRLLREEISAEEYAKRVKRRLREWPNGRSRTGLTGRGESS